MSASVEMDRLPGEAGNEEEKPSSITLPSLSSSASLHPITGVMNETSSGSGEAATASFSDDDEIDPHFRRHRHHHPCASVKRFKSDTQHHHEGNEVAEYPQTSKRDQDDDCASGEAEGHDINHFLVLKQEEEKDFDLR